MNSEKRIKIKSVHAQWFERSRLKTDNARFDTFGHLVYFVYFWSTKKNKNKQTLPMSTNEHSYQAWFQLVLINNKILH